MHGIIVKQPEKDLISEQEDLKRLEESLIQGRESLNGDMPDGQRVMREECISDLQEVWNATKDKIDGFKWLLNLGIKWIIIGEKYEQV